MPDPGITIFAIILKKDVKPNSELNRTIFFLHFSNISKGFNGFLFNRRSFASNISLLLIPEVKKEIIIPINPI